MKAGENRGYGDKASLSGNAEMPIFGQTMRPLGCKTIPSRLRQLALKMTNSAHVFFLNDTKVLTLLDSM